MTDIKCFNRWSTEGITVKDIGIAPYITLQAKIVPKTGARYAGKRFHKSNVFIVERLASKLMTTGHKAKKHFISSGHHTGKKNYALNIVESALVKVEAKLKKNPLFALVQGIENAAPREEVIAIEYGGARYPKAVDVSPQRRIDLALRYMTQGAFQKSFNKKMKIDDALADEIAGAAQSSGRSNAIAKKRDLERQASSSK
ncbi:MAG: 30S ribosomal protein S7 [Nanoarchaeota archaeon]|nr:30S ribosomal protein S7 [Nanoarchaeota archaeon]